MRVEAVLFRRNGIIIVQASTKAQDHEWHLDTELVTLPAHADDELLGQTILDALQRVGSRHPETETPPAQMRAYFEQRDALVGVRGDAEFARGCDAVEFLRYDDAFTMTPLVFSSSGGYGAWGGRQSVPLDIGAAELGALCKEGFDCEGVDSPAAGTPDHS